MTPLTPEQEAKLHPPKRYDIGVLAPLANRQPPPEMLAQMRETKSFNTRILMGTTGDGMGWAATQDMDGQIEISFSYPNSRPNNWQVQRWFTLVGMKPFCEESKASGKVRHFVVQRGTMQ